MPPISFSSFSFSGLSFESDCTASYQYVVPELVDEHGNQVDFQGDFGIMLLAYLWQNWCIKTPIELKAPKSLPMDPTDPNDPDYVDPPSSLRFRHGFPDKMSSLQVLTLQGDTPERNIDKESMGKGYWRMCTEVWVTLIARSLGRDGVDNENDQFTLLGIMERNVERLCNQYGHGVDRIVGIMDIEFAGGGRIYTVKDSWASSLWGSKWKIKMWYVKANKAG